MENDLSPASFNVEQKLISGFIHALIFCHVPGQGKKTGNDGGIFDLNIVHAPDMFFRNQEQMDRGRRVDIPEHYIVIIFIQKSCGNFAVDNPAEQTLI
jgi:hypothetical protein